MIRATIEELIHVSQLLLQGIDELKKILRSKLV